MSMRMASIEVFSGVLACVAMMLVTYIVMGL